MSKLQELHTMATSQLNRIASRIYDDMECISEFGNEEDDARMQVLGLTFDAIEKELADREAAAQWYAEYVEYAEAMVSANHS